MKLLSARTALPIALALAVAGCGSNSPSALKGSTASAQPTAAASPLATPKIPPTPVVTGGDTAAIVNGQKIPMSTYRTLLDLAVRESAGQAGATTKVLASETMTQIVDDEVVRQYAIAHGLTVTNAEFNTRIASDEKQFGGLAGLKQRLKQVGLSFDAYKLLVHTSVQRHKVADAVTPLRAAHVRHILIATTNHKPKRTDAQAHALAQQLLTQIQHGANFAALAKKYSDDTGSGKQGGDLGSFCTGLGLMVASFDHAAATLPPMHPTIIKSQYGYHIIEVLSRGLAKPGQCTQPGSTGQSAQPVVAEQSPAFQAWVQKQVSHAKVQRLARVA